MKRRFSCALALGFLFAVEPAGLPAQIPQQEVQRTPTARKPARPLPAALSAILLGEGREKLERPEEILDKMHLKDGDVVADIGCGPGYYSLRLAKRVAPHGAILAADLQQGMLDQLVERMKKQKVGNVYPVLGTAEDPHLPPGKVDWVLLVDAYHEFSEPQVMLERIRECLAPGGRVALLEYRAEQDPKTIPVPIPRDHKMTIEEVMSEWTPAGFELVRRLEFLPAQHYFIFKKKGDTTIVDPLWHEGIQIGPVESSGMPNHSSFGKHVHFAGQPEADHFHRLAELGVKTVLNLRTASEMDQLDFDEEATVQAAGMSYVHVPIGREQPANDDLLRIMSILDRAGDEPVLLHCASSNRVGMVWGMFRALHHGLGVEDAVKEGKAAGLRAAALEQRARTYVAEKTEGSSQ